MAAYEASPTAHIGGTLRVPGDKSISHRALMLAGIADGLSEITGFLSSEDCLATLGAMRAMGVQIEQRAPTHVLVRGRALHGLQAPQGELDMGNAGTAMRLFTGLLAAQRFGSCLVGDTSLMKRPMERVAGPLRSMGADVRTVDGHAPVSIGACGGLRGIDYDMPMASAQVKSAVLLAGLYAEGATSVRAPAVSRDHSERMLVSCGVRVEVEGLRVTLNPPRSLASFQLDVPGDFSSAAFFIVAGLLAAGPGGLVIENVGMNPTRTGLLDILRSMGADIVVREARLSGAEPVADLEVRASRLKGVTVAPALVPLAIDEFPVLFVAAACAEGETLISGAAELRVKESDRIAAMSEGFAALRVQHEVRPDGMRIEGRPEAAAFGAGAVDSHGDHRVAMAFAVASLRAAGAIRIGDVANVATSFPGFVPLARSIGFALHESTA